MKRFVFPVLISIMYIGQAAVSLSEGEWRKALYWVCATAIVWCIV